MKERLRTVVTLLNSVEKWWRDAWACVQMSDNINIRIIAARHLTQTSASIPVKLCCLVIAHVHGKYSWSSLLVPLFQHQHIPHIHNNMTTMFVYSLMTQFDQVEVCCGRRQAADVQVGFAELLRACAAAVAAAAGTGRSHGVRLHTGEPLLGLDRS